MHSLHLHAFSEQNVACCTRAFGCQVFAASLRPELAVPSYELFGSAEYKGHATEEGVKKVLKSDLDGMFKRYFFPVALCLCYLSS